MSIQNWLASTVGKRVVLSSAFCLAMCYVGLASAQETRFFLNDPWGNSLAEYDDTGTALVNRTVNVWGEPVDSDSNKTSLDRFEEGISARDVVGGSVQLLDSNMQMRNGRFHYPKLAAPLR